MTIIHSCYPKLPSPHSVGDSLVGYLSVTNWWLCKEQLLSLFNARTRKTPTQESSTALVPSKVSALHSKAQSGAQPWHRGGDTSRRRTVSLRRDWQNSYKQIFYSVLPQMWAPGNLCPHSPAKHQPYCRIYHSNPKLLWDGHENQGGRTRHSQTRDR